MITIPDNFETIVTEKLIQILASGDTEEQLFELVLDVIAPNIGPLSTEEDKQVNTEIIPVVNKVVQKAYRIMMAVKGE